MSLLERESLLTRMADLYTAARGRRPHIVVVSGEAGAGKTVLIEAFCAQLDPGRVVWGACDPVVPAHPFGPLIDIAQQVGGEFADVFRRGVPREVHEAFLHLLRGHDGPRVVVLDDMQWADDATLDLVRVVGRRLRSVAGLIIVSLRHDDLHPGHPVRLALGDLPATSTTTLTVPGLSRPTVEALTAGTPIDGAALHAATGGNPFYVTEVVAAGCADVPVTVRDAVLARANRLPTTARAVLHVVAVAGSRCERSVLRTICGPDAAIDVCLDTGMLVPITGSAVGFRHELARLAILDGLANRDRAELHKRLLRVLVESSSDAPIDLARLAHHAEAAGDEDAVQRFSPAAARQAAAGGAHRQAQAHYATALARAADIDRPTRAQLLAAHAHEAHLVGDLTAAITSQTEAVALWHDLGDRRAEGDAVQALAYLTWAGGDSERAGDLAAHAVALLEAEPTSPQLAQAYATQAQLLMIGGVQQAAVAIGQRALALAGELGVEPVVIHALNTIGTAQLCGGDHAGWVKLEESLHRAQAADLDDDIGRALVNLVGEARHTRRYDIAERYLAEALRFTTERQLDLNRQHLLADVAEILLEQGRWDDAADAAVQTLAAALPPDGMPPRLQALAVLGRLRARRGDPDAWAALDTGLGLALAQGEAGTVCPIRAARAEAAWLAGDLETAAIEADAGMTSALGDESPWLRGELAFWRWKATGSTDRPDGCAPPFTMHIDGDVGAAAAAWAAAGCPYRQALALADSDDESHLRQALELFHSLGARPAARLTASRMQARGARRIPRGPRPGTAANPARLTARQLDVLALLARGATNSQIAETLTVSPKTVDHHVSAVLAKLGVATRQLAAAEAHRLGLIDPG